MKSTWFRNRDGYEFAKLLREASNNSFHTVFRDFLNMSANSLMQAVTKFATGSIDQKREDDWNTLAETDKYREVFPKAFGHLILALEKQRGDFLGDVYGDMELNDKNFRGQCFTPYHLCVAMARMTLQGAKPDDFENRQIILSEPACGGGAMIYAMQDVLHEEGFLPFNYYVVAQDIDITCYWMTYIQSTLLGVPLTANWGNTLTLETWETATTLVGAMHPMKERKSKDKPVRVRKPRNKAVRQRTRSK